jgi:hypothetical protein
MTDGHCQIARYDSSRMLCWRPQPLTGVWALSFSKQPLSAWQTASRSALSGDRCDLPAVGKVAAIRTPQSERERDYARDPVKTAEDLKGVT